MPSKRDPADSLSDIIEEARWIATYLEGMDRAAFERDRRTSDAVERCLERVCEAIHRLADRAEALMPGYPWRDIQGFANRLRHAYDGIDLDVVWHAGVNLAPPLATDAARALSRLRAERGET